MDVESKVYNGDPAAKRFKQLTLHTSAVPINVARECTSVCGRRVFYINVRRTSLCTIFKHILKRIGTGFGPDIVAIADSTYKSIANPGWTFVNTDPYDVKSHKYQLARLVVGWRNGVTGGLVRFDSKTEHTVSLLVGTPNTTVLTRIVIAYLPPYKDTRTSDFAIDELATVVSRDDFPLIVVGDLNARMGKTVGDTFYCPRGHLLRALIFAGDFKIFNNRLPRPPMPTAAVNAENKPLTVLDKCSIVDYLLVEDEVVHAITKFHLIHTNSKGAETRTTTNIKSDHRALEFDLAL